MTGLRSWLAGAGALVAVLAFAPAAGATTGAGATSNASLYITGAGFGHGIGMSQYGAAGYALHGYSYKQILANYYAQTTLGTVNPSSTVTVLLKAKGAAAFSGATTIKGSKRKLDVSRNYSVLVVGGKLRIVSGGRTFGTYTPPLQVSGPGPLTLIGRGAYRGSFVFRPSTAGAGVMTVNSLGLDDYVRGVVGAEMPASWPMQALEAQAVAARTYAVAVGAIGADFDLYDNVRSQMYKGVAAETPTTNAAVAATRGQVVDYDGVPAVTYFFASSGGRTESIQNVWAGVAPEAWLVSEEDPYDDSFNNPYYRWHMSLSVSAADAKLGRLVHGRLEGINVLSRGVSPRVVQAQLVGTAGAATVSGNQLAADLGTPSTWMSFTTISAQGVQYSGTLPPATTTLAATTPGSTLTTPAPAATTPTSATTTTSGGVGPVEPFIAQTGAGLSYAVAGTIYPVDAGATVTVQLETANSWTFAGSGQVAADGSYTVPVLGPGIYRVLYKGIIGATISVH